MADYPLCVDCRWCSVKRAFREVVPPTTIPECSSPELKLSLVTGLPLWTYCYLQRMETPKNDTGPIHPHSELCGIEGNFFQPAATQEAADAS